ncbi:RING finger and CHY zinc finger domain-containing protein 1 [Fistulifera solaris]|uniref:RING finger and CHY zinc finger domain-containing protein 1 n=1 Tax=Fistulifera solaris TaxID=1519565 RepID=A0A1Z5JSA2_FISSO|nr:RING finger and CHY zinc finger domain-containing protein 1 [Fistulifera solaris]|eukprot:GAX16905.1 RING finger and CHY zinc finger domain-containing protein 1 [Fistulifera solaris]
MEDERFAHEDQDEDDMQVVDSDEEDSDDDDEMDNIDDSENPPGPTEEDAALDRRRAIQQVMADTSISPDEKRFRIQAIMSGNRTVVAPAPAPIQAAVEANATCVHYERNCNIIAPCCGRIFGCRICHDELSAPGHPPMNRFLIREVVCKNCHTRQPASNNCIHCHSIFGEFHCNICNLWMSMGKKPFHCDLCGFCRVGGIEAFRHCNQCCMCISISVFDTHHCFKDKYKNSCPVCREDMFSSRQAPQDLPCGHAIHAHCFRKLAGFDYRCPICKKTVVSQQSMAAAWEARARDIAEHPMPADLHRIVDIMCNDCEVKSHNCQWHFLGIQCPGCSSFNTVVENVVASGPDAAPSRNEGGAPSNAGGA